MRSRPTLVALQLLLAVAAALPGLSAAADDPLPPEVLQALQKAGVPPDAMAVMALPLSHREPPWQHRAQVPMQPASTMKLVTSVVALDRLGPNHRSHTEVLATGPIADGVLQGDLVLKGGADPDLGVPQFWALLAELRQRGITRVAGDLLIDRTLFRPARMDIGVPPFDDAMEFQYNVIPDALELAGNLLPLEIRSGPEGLSASTVPPLDGIEFDTRAMVINDAACKDWDRDWKPPLVRRLDDGRTRIELQGGFPAQCSKRTDLQLIDRLELAERLFRSLWQGLGGQWAGRAREAAAPADAKLLLRRTGRPWGEVLRPMNKTSDNPVTRLLFLQLGLGGMDTQPQATTAELAAKTVRGWFVEHGIDPAGLVLDNGSGLSRSERITPQQLARLLAVHWSKPTSADLIATLPIAGLDGSLRPLRDSPAMPWARLKPGTLRNVVALAGYLRDRRGRPWAVAMMINHDDAAKARPALLALVDSFARVGPTRSRMRELRR